MVFKEYKDFKEMFIELNKYMIDNSDKASSTENTFSDLIIKVNSIDTGNLDITHISYKIGKIKHLVNKYVDINKLKAFIEEKDSCTKNTLAFDFELEQGCIKTIILSRDNRKGDFSEAKIFFRTVDVSKKLLPDLMLIRYILEKCEVSECTFYMCQAFQMPSNIMCISKSILGLDRKYFSKPNKFNKGINRYFGYYDKFSPETKTSNGPFNRIYQYLWECENGVIRKPVTYKDCRKELERMLYGR